MPHLHLGNHRPKLQLVQFYAIILVWILSFTLNRRFQYPLKTAEPCERWMVGWLLLQSMMEVDDLSPPVDIFYIPVKYC